MQNELVEIIGKVKGWDVSHLKLLENVSCITVSEAIEAMKLVLNEQPKIELESTIILNKYGLSLVEKLHSTLKKTLEDLEQFKKQKNGK